MKKSMKVEIEKVNRVFNDFFKIDEAYLKFEKFNGEMSETVRRLNFNRGDAVACIVYNSDSKRVILVNQFKYPASIKGTGWILETVAGMIEDGESPEESLKREIVEEIGYDPKNIKFISKFYVSPGGTSERIFLYFVEVDNSTRVSDGGGLQAEHEDIQLVELGIEEACNMLDEGAIEDAKTIIAINWLKHNLNL